MFFCQILRHDSNYRSSDVEIQQRATEYLKLSEVCSPTVLATVLEIMPPYPEKQSPLLVRLKQKKPLMEAEGAEAEPSQTSNAAVHADDAPKLPEATVRRQALWRWISLASIVSRFIFIKHRSKRTLYSSRSMHQKQTVITSNRRPTSRSRLRPERNFCSRRATSSSRMNFYKLVSKVKRTNLLSVLNCTMETRPTPPSAMFPLVCSFWVILNQVCRDHVAQGWVSQTFVDVDLRILMDPVQSTIEPRAQAKQTGTIDCLKDFKDSPRMNLSFLYVDDRSRTIFATFFAFF